MNLCPHTRELQKLRRRTSTPSVTPLPSPGKPQVLGRSQAEGHPTPALALSPTVDSQGDGRGSPEGTSDTEEVAGSGFVVVAPGLVRGQTVGSTVKDEAPEHGTTQTRDDFDGLDSEIRESEAGGLTPTLSGFEDPSESIEVLLEPIAGNEGDLELEDTGRESREMEGETKAGETETSISEDRQTLDSQDAIIGDQSTVTETVAGSGSMAAGARQTGLTGSPLGSKGQYQEAEYARQLRNEAKRLLKASSSR